jgi:NADH-quinone oxidoreductase subunit C
VNGAIILQLLNDRFPDIEKVESAPHGFFTLEIPVAHIKEVMQFLKEDPNTNFVFLTDLCAVHYPNQGNREFAVVYHLHNLETNFRMRLKTFVGRDNIDVPSMVDLYSAANWMERETFDFYGINFVGHPNLKRILNMDDMTYHPLRKEYALEDGTRTDKDDRFFGRDGHEGRSFDHRKSLAKENG